MGYWLANSSCVPFTFGSTATNYVVAEGSDTAEISYTRLRNQLKSNPKSREKLVNFEIRNN